jgi:hypothetical protein
VKEHEPIAEIMAAFPFKAPLPRPDEPARPRFTYEGEPIGWRPIFWLTTNREWKTVLQDYVNWAFLQPDRELLILDIEQREEWFVQRGIVPQEELAAWPRKRLELAVEIRRDGHGGILEANWPQNAELRQPPKSD